MCSHQPGEHVGAGWYWSDLLASEPRFDGVRITSRRHDGCPSDRQAGLEPCNANSCVSSADDGGTVDCLFDRSRVPGLRYKQQSAAILQLRQSQRCVHRTQQHGRFSEHNAAGTLLGSGKSWCRRNDRSANNPGGRYRLRRSVHRDGSLWSDDALLQQHCTRNHSSVHQLYASSSSPRIQQCAGVHFERHMDRSCRHHPSQGHGLGWRRTGRLHRKCGQRFWGRRWRWRICPKDRHGPDARNGDYGHCWRRR